MSFKPWYHDSSFTLPTVTWLKKGELRAWERLVRQARKLGVITASKRDGLLALLRVVGWQHKLQVAQSVLAAMADISVDTLGRALEFGVEAGWLRIHHIIQRGARGGGTVQDINCYELVLPPDPQAADESVLQGFKRTLLAKKALRICRRVTRNLRQGVIFDLAEEQERANQSQQRQLALLRGG